MDGAASGGAAGIQSLAMRRLLIVPAAGLGSRLNSPVPKVLVPVGGRPMLDRLIELSAPFVQAIAVVAHPSFSAAVGSHLDRTRGSGLLYGVVEQPSPTGMLDAIMAAAPMVSADQPDSVWILWGDQVAVLPQTMARLAEVMSRQPAPPLAFPTVAASDPYIHFPRDASGRITGVLQRREGDTMPADGESDIGLFAMSRQTYERRLPEYAAVASPGRGTRERNFLPFIPWLAALDDVETFPCTDPREARGINTPEDLREVEAWLQSRRPPAP